MLSWRLKTSQKRCLKLTCFCGKDNKVDVLSDKSCCWLWWSRLGRAVIKGHTCRPTNLHNFYASLLSPHAAANVFPPPAKTLLYYTWQQQWLRQRSPKGKSILFHQNIKWLTVSPPAGYTNLLLLSMSCSLSMLVLSLVLFFCRYFSFLSIPPSTLSLSPWTPCPSSEHLRKIRTWERLKAPHCCGVQRTNMNHLLRLFPQLFLATFEEDGRGAVEAHVLGGGDV